MIEITIDEIIDKVESRGRMVRFERPIPVYDNYDGNSISKVVFVGLANLAEPYGNTYNVQLVAITDENKWYDVRDYFEDEHAVLTTFYHLF